MRISDWRSDVCSSDLFPGRLLNFVNVPAHARGGAAPRDCRFPPLCLAVSVGRRLGWRVRREGATMTTTDQRTNCHGLAMTAADDAAVAHYDATIAAYLGLRKDTGEHLKRTLAADSDLVLGHVAKGNFMKLFCTPPLERKAAQSLAAAESSAEARGANPREPRTIAALRAWCRGALRGAVAEWEATHGRAAGGERVWKDVENWGAP